MRSILSLFAAVGCVAVVSLTSTRIVVRPSTQSTQVRSAATRLPFSQHPTSPHAASDVELIQELREAKDIKLVGRFLKEACDSRRVSSSGPHTDSPNSAMCEGIEVCQTPLTTRFSDLGETTAATVGDTSFEPTPGSFEKFSFNVTVTALRRIAHFSALESRTDHNGFDAEDHALLSNILRTVAEELVASVSSESTLDMTLLASILQAVSIISNTKRLPQTQPLATMVIELMKRHDVSQIHSLGPIRLVQCLEALGKLQITDLHFRQILVQRLVKADAIAKVPARYLSYGLAALASAEATTEEDEVLLTRTFMRRLRKQKVRQDARISDLLRALVASSVILKKGGMVNFRDEGVIFGFTILRSILDVRAETSHKFIAAEMADLFSSWAALSTKTRQDAVIGELLSICQEENIFASCGIEELARILLSICQLEGPGRGEAIELGGKRLLDIVRQGDTRLSSCEPHLVNQILRWSLSRHAKNVTVMEPYVEASKLLYTDRRFLQGCGLAELANHLWFLSFARVFDHKTLLAVGQRLLDPHLVNDCTPKLASRILATYTCTLLLGKTLGVEDAEHLDDVTHNLFHSYGGHLLTTQLAPSEISPALYAYAKTSYIQDMGIFDHLVSLMALKGKEGNARQLAQTLWSCGKMMAWEGEDADAPPYIECARRISHELKSRIDEVSAIDAAQCIWALGRLGIDDLEIVTAFSVRAGELAGSMNSAEVSNTIWGLAKLRPESSDRPLVTRLVQRLTQDAVDVSATEASSIMYALARMRYRDEELFQTLSGVVIDKINDTTAQTIANTLWAHKTMDLRPPRKLIELWASQKLGIVGVQELKPQG